MMPFCASGTVASAGSKAVRSLELVGCTADSIDKRQSSSAIWGMCSASGDTRDCHSVLLMAQACYLAGSKRGAAGGSSGRRGHGGGRGSRIRGGGSLQPGVCLRTMRSGSTTSVLACGTLLGAMTYWPNHAHTACSFVGTSSNFTLRVLASESGRLFEGSNLKKVQIPAGKIKVKMDSEGIQQVVLAASAAGAFLDFGCLRHTVLTKRMLQNLIGLQQGLTEPFIV